MENVLLLVDLQNLWDSCVSQYGKRVRVNFNILPSKCKTKRSDNVRAIAFVVRKVDKNQENLIKRLMDFGYEIIIKVFGDDQVADFSSEMIQFIEENKDTFDSVAIGGGSHQMENVLEVANTLGKHTVLLGFSHGITKTAAQGADIVRILSKKDTVL